MRRSRLECPGRLLICELPSLNISCCHSHHGRYTSALKNSSIDDDSRVIKRNRCLAYLKSGSYEAAIQDVDGLGPNVKKTEAELYRMERALYELRRYQECHQIFELRSSQYLNCQPAMDEVARTKHRLQEQTTGEYDFRRMYKAAEKTPPNLDSATYVGPIEVKETEDRENGVFTTKDVMAGDLVLCEKAFACVPAIDNTQTMVPPSLGPLLGDYIHERRVVLRCQADLVTAIGHKMYRNPSLINSITSLAHGDYDTVQTKIVDGIPVIDS